MRKQDNLLQLIDTLTPNEKRYFKLFSNLQPGDKRYLQLFDALADKQHYDGGGLSKELGLNAKQLKSDKYYLNNNLLRVISNNDEVSAEISIYRNYLEAHSLIERRLFNYAIEFVEKCIERAQQLELLFFLPNFIVLKQTCLYGLQRHEEIPALQKKFMLCNEATTELFEINQLRYAIAGAERKRDEKEMLALFKHRLLKVKPERLKSLRARIAWYDIMTRYTMFYDTPEAFLKLMKAESALYKREQAVKQIDPLTYIHSYVKVAKAEMKVDACANALAWLEKFSALLEKPGLNISAEKIKALRTYGYYNRSMALRGLDRFEEACPLAQKSCRELGEGYPYEQYSYTFEYALTLFHTGRFTEAATELDTLLQLKTEMRSDIQLLVRPLMILTQYELKNMVLIPYLIKSAKAWLKRQKKQSPEADTFFSFMHALSKADKKAMARILPAFKKAESTDAIGYLSGMNLNTAAFINRQMVKYRI